MIVGFAAFAIGYAIFYWGLHHLPWYAQSGRFSLWQLLGLNVLTGANVGPFPDITLGGPMTPTPSTAGATLTSAQTTSATTTPTSTPTSGSVQNQFASALLAAIGAPNTPTNQSLIAAWGACESSWSTPAGANNFLNMKNNDGSWASFSSPSAAGTAAGQRLVGAGYSVYGYNEIVTALQQQNSSAFASAVGDSAWGTSGACLAGAT